MISFILSLAALVLGYFIHGRFVEKIFGPDDRSTPAVAKADGVDFLVLPSWKVFMIQFLNIAGTGPIFGAIMGAWYGPMAYLWIVLGCIFAGATHDYLCGMLSMRHGGANLPTLIGDYLGKTTKKIMLIFSVFLLMMVGVVFVYSPALLLGDMAGGVMTWVIVIFVYYVLATMLPIDKIIGRFYPIFAFALLFMALALFIVLFIKMPTLPEIWSNLADHNLNTPKELLGADSFIAKNPVFPCLFLTIACGAISGFHATQSPLMARCVQSEKMGRPIFYGSMITEGCVALIWATVSSWFFYHGGWREWLHGFKGFNGYQGAAFYWRNGNAEYGKLSGYPLKLAVGSYQLTFAQAAWKESPRYKVQILNASEKVIAESSTYTAAPNANGSTVANVSSAKTYELPFDITTAGNYIIRFVNMTTGGTFQEFLLLECRINTAEKEKPDGIASLSSDSKSSADIYSITGVKQQSLQPGLNIIRTPEGKARKVLILGGK